ncbi:MAG TPA: hypothetical protein VIL26_00285 [Clostridia bacterium]
MKRFLIFVLVFLMSFCMLSLIACKKEGNVCPDPSAHNHVCPDVEECPDVGMHSLPKYPESEFVLPIDIPQINPNVKGKLTVSPALVEINYDGEAASDEQWRNSIIFDLGEHDFTRKTKIGLNVKGVGDSIWVKGLTSDGKTIFEGEVGTSSTWQLKELVIPQDNRYNLIKIAKVIINAPKPSQGLRAGKIFICGIWFDGDAEPAKAPIYNPEDYEVVYEFDLSVDTDGDSFAFTDNTATAGDGKVTATYDVTEKSITFVNIGYSDWLNIAFKAPEKDSEENIIDYSDVCYVVIEFVATSGAIIKAQADWNDSASTREFDGVQDGETTAVWAMAYDGYTAWGAVTFIPTYLKEGVTEATVILKSIKLVKEKE